MVRAGCPLPPLPPTADPRMPPTSAASAKSWRRHCSLMGCLPPPDLGGRGTPFAAPAKLDDLWSALDGRFSLYPQSMNTEKRPSSADHKSSSLAGAAKWILD